MEKGERVYRAFDFRIFNQMFVLSLSQRAYSTIFRALCESGVRAGSTDPGVCIKLNDDISVVGYSSYYVMMMTEAGMKQLYAALENAVKRWASDDWMVKNLLSKMDQGNQWLAEVRAAEQSQDDDDEDLPPVPSYGRSSRERDQPRQRA
jgi:hypothetical protein